MSILQNQSQGYSSGLNAVFPNQSGNYNQIQRLSNNEQLNLQINPRNGIFSPSFGENMEFSNHVQENQMALDSVFGYPQGIQGTPNGNKQFLSSINQSFSKKQTQQKKINIESLLNEEQNINSNEFQIKENELLSKNSLFTDLSFHSPLGNNFSSPQNISWIRLSELYQSASIFPPQFSAQGLTTGIMCSDKLFSLYSYLIRNPHLIKRLFQSTQFSPQGIYSMWLQINGIWQNIIVDDFVPMINSGGDVKHAFASLNGINTNLWLIILEKCFAKAYCGYMNIQSSLIHQDFSDITGAPYVFIQSSLKNQTIQEMKQCDDYTWKQIKQSIMERYIITAYSKQSTELNSGEVYYVDDALEFEQQKGDISKMLRLWNCRQYTHFIIQLDLFRKNTILKYE